MDEQVNVGNATSIKHRMHAKICMGFFATIFSVWIKTATKKCECCRLSRCRQDGHVQTDAYQKWCVASRFVRD